MRDWIGCSWIWLKTCLAALTTRHSLSVAPLKSHLVTNVLKWETSIGVNLVRHNALWAPHQFGLWPAPYIQCENGCGAALLGRHLVHLGWATAGPQRPRDPINFIPKALGQISCAPLLCTYQLSRILSSGWLPVSSWTLSKDVHPWNSISFSPALSMLNSLRTRTLGRHGGTVVSTAASQRQGPGFDSRLGSLSVWSLHILPVSAWVSSGCSGFLPQSKDLLLHRRILWF